MNAPHPFRALHGHLLAAPKPVSVAEAGQIDLREAIRREVLAEVHGALDALGGYFDPRDERACGRDERLGECLAVVDGLLDTQPAMVVGLTEWRAA